MTKLPPDATKTIVSARGITNRFGKVVVHQDVDLDVRTGEILGVAGGSGSGKSVLLKTLIGLRRPQAGHVLLAGKPVAEIGPSERAALFGVLFQQGALFSSLSVAQNVMFPMREHDHKSDAERQTVAAQKLAEVGLPADTGQKQPSDLSGGMVKRAALARALALDPQILFLDEPTADLDPISASAIDALILQLKASLGITVVLVTHDLTTLFTVCDRIAFLSEKKLTIGTVSQLTRSSKPGIHEFFHGPRADMARAKSTGATPRAIGSHGNG